MYGQIQKYPSYTSFTSYMNSDNLPYIAKVITNLLTRKPGYCFLPSLPYLTINIEKFGWLHRYNQPPLLIIVTLALFLVMTMKSSSTMIC